MARPIEVGAFAGYSGLCVVRAPGEGGHLVACDVSEAWTAVARRFREEAGVDGRIDLRIALAFETPDALIADGQAATCDMAFIDPDKANHDTCHERCLTLMCSGGLVMVDNVLRCNAVIDDDDTSDETEAIGALNAKMGRDDRIDMALLPAGDGLTLARKRRARSGIGQGVADPETFGLFQHGVGQGDVRG